MKRGDESRGIFNLAAGGTSAFKSRISQAIGIPLTSSGPSAGSGVSS